MGNQEVNYEYPSGSGEKNPKWLDSVLNIVLLLDRILQISILEEGFQKCQESE